VLEYVYDDFAVAHPKVSQCRFRKIGRLASEEVILKLVKNKCIGDYLCCMD